MNKKESHIARLISTRIKGVDPTAEVILFGSHAIGKASRGSDWDILILIDNQLVNRSIESIYRDEMFLLELELAEPISTFVYSKTDWETKFTFTPLYNSIKREGVKI